MAHAFLFDLNGTMIDDMPFHEHAWSSILNNDLKAGLSAEEVKKQMYGKNEEVLVRIFGADKFTEQEMQKISVEKEKRYQKEYLPHLQLIKGLEDFLEKAKAHNIKIAMGSAAIPFNIDFVLNNLNLRKYFEVIISADDVIKSKPEAETFLKAAKQLNILPEHCIVFEDAPKGVEAALNAGMKAVVLTTTNAKEAFNQYSNILYFISDYRDEKVNTLFN